ncbi:hypothetical protein SLUN_00455 [Streptomyces lunaelactis]|uniref:Major facilitator superfamily (MFS) profile domain-containing protein n=1 Tax=Streptomyces lunaelactis TaxID=1535768 RepID=A0A2R4TDF0_9ACTN|nr:hypothetical protein SLUN_00455 [Streptomyces lunaelactis]NUK88340.1 MFS transporter [Streptomyces lunaelactis]
MTAPARTTLPAAPTAPETHRWPPVIWALLLGTFVVRAAGFALPFLSYRLAELGFSISTIGRILAAFGGGWLLGQLLCGWLADRVGRRTTLVGAMTVATITMPALAAAQSLCAVLAAAFVSGMVFDAPRPIVSAVILDTIPTESGRTQINGWRHMAVNVAAGLTGAIGGLLAGDAGTSPLFLINAAGCASCGILALLVMKPDRTAPRPLAERSSLRRPLTDGRLWLLWMASLAALTCAAAMFSALPLLMASDGLNAAAYGRTQAVAAIVVLALSPVLTPRLSRRAERPTPMVGVLATGSLLLGAGMGAAGLANDTAGYALASSLAVPGEIVLFIAAGSILNHISPPDSRGLYAGIWGTTMAVAVIVSPLLAAWSLQTGGDLLAGATILGSGLLGAALCAPLKALLHPGSPPTATHPAAAESLRLQRVPKPSASGRLLHPDAALHGGGAS